MILHTLLFTTVLLSPKHVIALIEIMTIAVVIALFIFAMFFDVFDTTEKRITYWVIVAIFIIFLMPGIIALSSLYSFL
jgi:hypothetical protein